MKLKPLFAAAALAAPTFAYAVNCNLITEGGTATNLLAANSTATVNGAILTNTDNQATGSGVIDSFVRVSGNDDCLQGYNTDARPLQFDENSSPIFTHDLPLSAVPIVTIGGVQYREFLLDINQTGEDPLLSLNEVEIYLHNTDNLSSLAGLTPIWELDGAGNVIVNLDYNLNSGSGSGDLFLYVPDSLFTGGTFVTLFSQFGDGNNNNDGFEEWAVRTATPVNVAEPGILALLGIALLALGGTRRRRTV